VWYVKYHAKLYQVIKATKVLKAEDGSLTSTSTDPSCVWRKKIHGALLFGSEGLKQSMLMVWREEDVDGVKLDCLTRARQRGVLVG